MTRVPQMKRWLSLVICIIMCVSLIPVEAAFADEPEIALAESAGEIQLEAEAAVPDEYETAEVPVVEEAAEEPAVEEPVAEESVAEGPATEVKEVDLKTEEAEAEVEVVNAEELSPVAVKFTASLSSSLATPVLKSAVKNGNTIKVTWGAVTGAAKYRVFRKGPSDKSWVRLTDTTGLAYNDGNVANNTKYTYTVRCITADGKTYTSSFDSTGVSCTYYIYTAPTLVSATAVANGIEVKWNAVGGAEKYRLFRKQSGTSWVKVTDTTGTSFVDISCSPGVAYTYTVRCISGDLKSYTSSFDSKGKTATYTQKVAVSSLNCIIGGIEVKWNNVGAPHYRVYRKANSGEWKAITTTNSTTTSFTDKDVVSGNTYSYHVRALADNGSTVIGTYDATGKTTQYYDTPTILKPASVASNGEITINWIAVSGVTKYRVFRKTTGGWVKLADTSNNFYTDKTAAANTVYHYTVRCLNAAGNAYVSGHESPGVEATYVGAPVLKSANVAETGGITVTWNVVSGYTKYQIYRRLTSGNFAPLTTVSVADAKTGSYTDTSVVSGAQYFYTVACMSGSSVVGEYDKSGVFCTCFANPSVSSVSVAEQNAKGVTVKWSSVDGVSKYAVLRKESSATTWTKIAETNALTYTDNTAASGKTYSYTVRCLNTNGTYASGHSSGKSITYYGQPVLSSAVVVDGNPAGSTGTVKITWQAVTGATYYNVYRKTGDGGWNSSSNLKKVGVAVNGTSFVDTPPSSGVKYTYTVRVSDDSGKNLGSYDPTGKSVTFYKVPQLQTPTVATGSITVKWSAVDNAAGYQVYRKVPGASWTLIKTINDKTTLTYKDTNVIAGQQYVYTVRAFNGSVRSGYNISGVTVTAK